MGDEPFTFSRSGRSNGTILAVALTWLCCVLALLVFDAAGWIIALILLFTLPALWDIWSARVAGAELTDTHLSWYSGRARVDLDLTEIDHIRLVTRLDLTVRAAAVLTSGRKLRLPPESTPPHKAFEDALHAREVRTERHHFSLL